MLKRFLLCALTIGLISSSASISAAKPTTVLGKISAGALQIINRHSYLMSLPMWSYIASKTANPAFHGEDMAPVIVVSTLGWLICGRLLKTTTGVIMNQFDIEPIRD